MKKISYFKEYISECVMEVISKNRFHLKDLFRNSGFNFIKLKNEIIKITLQDINDDERIIESLSNYLDVNQYSIEEMIKSVK